MISAPSPTPASFRARGWLLIVVGLLLSGGVGALMWFLNGFVYRPVLISVSSRFTGSHALLVHIFMMLGSLVAFGLVTMVLGIYQVRHGRQSKALLVLFILALAAVVGSAVVVTLEARVVKTAETAAP